MQQAAKDFEFNPEAEGDWQQQLAQFVRQEVKSMTQAEAQEKEQHAERLLQQEFETKFRQGMNKFDDFREVISSLALRDFKPYDACYTALWKTLQPFCMQRPNATLQSLSVYLKYAIPMLK